jgi:hypothetical protein
MGTEPRPEINQAPPVPDEELEQIAKLAEVPTVEWTSFFDDVRELVDGTSTGGPSRQAYLVHLCPR